MFVRQFGELWTYAGNPTLMSVTGKANDRERPAWAAGSKKELTFQVVGAWRKGQNVPAQFESLRPVLLSLFDMVDRKRGDVSAELLTLRHWKKLWSAAKAPAPEIGCPYPGLASYHSEDHARFFGRRHATAALTELARSTSASGGGIIAVTGGSGAGKSSLLAAGLVPALSDWTIVCGTPGENPSAVMSEMATSGTRRLLVVDQFEELFAAAVDEQARAQFLDALTSLAERGCTIVLGVRADFYDRCLQYPTLAHALAERQYLLTPMTADELAEAIRGPARAVGFTVENGLVELISAELATTGHPDGRYAGALPLLSHVMAATWQRRSGRKLTVAGYRAAGGITGAVAATADAAWTELDEPQQDAAKAMLLRMVTSSTDTRDVRRHVSLSELTTRAADPDAATRALEQLALARLISVDTETATLVHEAVLDAWPQLRDWVDADRESRLFRQRVDADSAEWTVAQRDSALLYRGTRLTQLRERHHELDGPAREFADASLAAHRRKRWFRAGLVMAGVVLLISALVSYTQARADRKSSDDAFYRSVLGYADNLQAVDPSLSAQFDVLAAQLRPGDNDARTRLLQSQNLPIDNVFQDPGGTVQDLAYLDGNRIASADSDGSLRVWSTGDTSKAEPIATLPGHSKLTKLSTAAGILAASATDGSVGLWRTTEPGPPQQLAMLHVASPVIYIQISHDGRVLAAVTDDGNVTLWNIADPADPTRVEGLPPIKGHATSAAFTGSDGALLIAYETDHTLQETLLRLDPAHHPVDSTPITLPFDLQVSALSGTTLAVGGAPLDRSSGAPGSEVQLWRLDDPTHPHPVAVPIPLPGAPLQRISLNADATILATATVSGTTLWDLADPIRPAQLGLPLPGTSATCPAATTHGCSSTITGLRFAPDGHTVAVSDQTGDIHLWHLPSAVVAGQAGNIDPLAQTVSADGRRMLTTAPGADAHVWDISDPTAIHSIITIPHPDPRASGLAGINEDGTLATLPIDGAIELLNITGPTPTLLGRFPGTQGAAFVPGHPWLLAISVNLVVEAQIWDYSAKGPPVPVGRPVFPPVNATLIPQTGIQAAMRGNTAVVLADTLQVWDLSAGLPTTPVGTAAVPRGDSFFGITITADAKTVVAAGNFGTLQIWDISNPARIHLRATPIQMSANNIASLDFSTDGHQLLVGSTDGTVRLWDFTNPSHPTPIGQTITPPSSPRWEVKYIPGTKYVIGVGDNGTLRVWNMNPDDALRRTCALTGTTITTQLTTFLRQQGQTRAVPPLCD
ncbi:NACHT and WD repeat domain-containing protein [Nocardia nova]